MMQNKTGIAFLAGLILASSILLAGCQKKSASLTNSNANSQLATPVDYTINQGDTIFFWGQGCPHCENVEKFLQDNSGLIEKLKIKKFEVYNDAKAQKLFFEKVQECGLSSNGVPLLYQDGKCTPGDQPIIEQLKKSL
jgi:uncharacterized lipoprotein YajG